MLVHIGCSVDSHYFLKKLQEEVTVENLLQEYHHADRKIFAQKAEELKAYLGHGSSKNMAKILMDIPICRL